MAAKKKTLPKDFDALLEEGSLETLKAVFNDREVDARGGHGKQTALAFDRCPDELARWLVAQGADLSARDTWGNTPLHSRAKSVRGKIDVLLELGANVHDDEASIGTPLHAAANYKRVENARKLIAKGAAVDAKDESGLTPLEGALQGCSNAELLEMAELAKVMLDAGARKTPAMPGFVKEIGKRFEFHRSAFNKDTVEESSRALDTLYQLFGATPVEQRKMHDGVAPIEVKSTRWQQQHTELWNLLVPSSGYAATVQGEVTRIAGRISHEILDNGGGNWDGEFVKMANAFLTHVRSGNPLTQDELAWLWPIINDLERGKDTDCAKLTELGVAWVLRNPKPMALPKPDYTR